MINCTLLASEATLEVSNKTVTFQKPYRASINHTFQCFTKATSKNNWTVIRWISIILSRLRNGNYSSPFPTSWKLTTNLNLIKRLEMEISRTGWKLFQEFIMNLIWTDSCIMRFHNTVCQFRERKRLIIIFKINRFEIEFTLLCIFLLFWNGLL